MYEKYLVRSLIVVVLWGILAMPTTVLGQYTFGDWARDHGYLPGDVMPGRMMIDGRLHSPIESLNGISSYDWTATPTKDLLLYYHQITNVQSHTFCGLPNLEELVIARGQIANIEANAFVGLTNLRLLYLYDNHLSNIESGAFSGLKNLTHLYLDGNSEMLELNLGRANFSNLAYFDVGGNVNIGSVSLNNTVINQKSLGVLFNGGSSYPWYVGIGDLDGITMLDLSGIDFVNINDLTPLYVMDDLTDLWLVDTKNIDAFQLDLLLDNLATIDSPDTEGILYMTQANFDAFNTAGGGLLAAWDAEPGHHVEIIIPEPATIVLLLILTAGVLACCRMRTY